MSFILDALKKSETDRQQRGTAEFANVPSSSGRRERPPVWLWVVAVLLLVNLVVLVGIMLRPEVSVSEPVARQVTEATALEVDEARDRVIDNFADQVASARENAPPREDPVKPAANTSPPAESMPAVTIARQPVSTATLPTIYQLQASGEGISLAPLLTGEGAFPEDRAGSPACFPARVRRWRWPAGNWYCPSCTWISTSSAKLQKTASCSST